MMIWILVKVVEIIIMRYENYLDRLKIIIFKRVVVVKIKWEILKVFIINMVGNNH